MKRLWKLRFLAVTTLLLVMLSSTASALDIKTLALTAQPDRCPIAANTDFAAVIELNQALTGTVDATLGSGATWSGPISGTSVTTGDLISPFPYADTLTVVLKDATGKVLMSVIAAPISRCPWNKAAVIYTVVYRDP